MTTAGRKPPRIVDVPAVEGPTAPLCFASDARMVHCDRRKGHQGPHSWELLEPAALTTPPRLAPAPLLTMTESELGTAAGELRRTDNEGAVWSRAWLDLVLRELAAQRLARARERREAFRAGFLAVLNRAEKSGWLLYGPAAADVESTAWEAWLKALRDQEEA